MDGGLDRRTLLKGTIAAAVVAAAPNAQAQETVKNAEAPQSPFFKSTVAFVDLMKQLFGKAEQNSIPELLAGLNGVFEAYFEEYFSERCEMRDVDPSLRRTAAVDSEAIWQAFHCGLLKGIDPRIISVLLSQGTPVHDKAAEESLAYVSEQNELMTPAPPESQA